MFISGYANTGNVFYNLNALRACYRSSPVVTGADREHPDDAAQILPVATRFNEKNRHIVRKTNVVATFKDA